MSRPLGRRQLDLLQSMCVGRFMVSPSGRREQTTVRGLERAGLVQAFAGGGLLHITPDGLRALAAAIDAGRISIENMAAQITRRDIA